MKAFWVLVAVAALAVFLVKGGKQFVLGLDLAGGSALTYKIETASLPSDSNVNDAVASLRDVVERRVNLFGVTEARELIDNDPDLQSYPDLSALVKDRDTVHME